MYQGRIGLPNVIRSRENLGTHVYRPYMARGGWPSRQGLGYRQGLKIHPTSMSMLGEQYMDSRIHLWHYFTERHIPHSKLEQIEARSLDRATMCLFLESKDRHMGRRKAIRCSLWWIFSDIDAQVHWSASWSGAALAAWQTLTSCHILMVVAAHLWGVSTLLILICHIFSWCACWPGQFYLRHWKMIDGHRFTHVRIHAAMDSIIN